MKPLKTLLLLFSLLCLFSCEKSGSEFNSYQEDFTKKEFFYHVDVYSNEITCANSLVITYCSTKDSLIYNTGSTIYLPTTIEYTKDSLFLIDKVFGISNSNKIECIFHYYIINVKYL